MLLSTKEHAALNDLIIGRKIGWRLAPAVLSGLVLGTAMGSYPLRCGRFRGRT